MSKKCEITGKKTVRGRSYTMRGIAKKKKGIGLKVTGKTKRSFLPNIRKKRFWFPEESRFVCLKIATSAMRDIEKKGISQIIRDLRARGVTV